MDLRKELLKENSKKNVQQISNWIGNDKRKFHLLMELFLNGEKRVSQIAGWVVCNCAENNTTLITPFVHELIEKAKDKSAHNSAKRYITRSLCFIKLNEIDAGPIAQLCFDFLADRKQDVAVRVFSMQVLYNLAIQEPDLRNELKLLIQENLENEKPAYKSKGSKILKALDSLQ